MIQDEMTARAVHTLFETLAMMAGARYYFYLRKKSGQPSALYGTSFLVVAGCLLGAGLGNKAVFWAEMPHVWNHDAGILGFFAGGQSMVGGLLGGLLGVEIAKHLSEHKTSTGDLFVFPILLGLIIGRIGCFLAGLHDGTFGVATDLPWGIDFGDGVHRHPTQLYEIFFAGLLWFLLKSKQTQLARTPGAMFKLMLSSYLLWRFTVDFLKPVPYEYLFGLSGIQWICMLALLIYVPVNLSGFRQTFLALKVSS